ncbi:MAG: GNAT family N-acetyltransferase, partial [Ferruginibacter sp.]
EQIDKKKWDDCINTAGNGLIYAYADYLDAMSKHWDALVLDDYKAVMPLTYNKKYGVYYLYQPPFTASLGVFGNGLSADIIDEFLNSIPEKFRYWDIYLNHGNYFQLKRFNLYERMNYILTLNNSYENIYVHFRDNIKRNIKKCEQAGTVIKKNIPVKDVIALSRERSQAIAGYTEKDFVNVSQLYEILHARQKAITYGIYNSSNRLMASAAFFFSHKRAYYILVGNDPDGKTMGASHALINAFIKDHAAQDLMLDFEGSDVPSLAFFYSSFGSSEERYPGLKMNRLPFWMKLFKK